MVIWNKNKILFFLFFTFFQIGILKKNTVIVFF
jgi:hypothetical protein